MKKVFGFLLSLICLLNFTTSVNALSNRINVYESTTKFEFVDGLEIYYNKSGSYPLYILDIDTYYNSVTTLSDPEVISAGFQYIINNSNPISNSDKNYYITQVAILWYEDYLNGNNNNISSSLKEYITSNTNNIVCYHINKLVNNAKMYSEKDNYISFETKKISFTKSGNYYYSNEIDVVTNNLYTTPTISFYNAPTSTQIINNNVKTNGNGSFQIQIPATSLTNFNKEEFEVNIKGYTTNNTAYVYNNGGNEEAIYAYNYSGTRTLVEESIPVVIENMIADTNVRIKVLDTNGNYIKNIKYYVYSGNCKNTTCDSDNYVTSFTTGSSYVTLEDILNEGTYTLVKKTNTSYNLNDKELFEIDDTRSLQTVTITSDNYIYNDNTNTNNYKDVTIYNSINNYSNIIKIYKTNGSLVDTYRSNNTNYQITLYEGNYYIIDSENLVKVYFKIDNNGDLLITEGNKEVEYNSIDLDKYYIRYVTDSDTSNNTGDDYIIDEDGTIHIGNLDGVDSIDISQSVETTTDINWISNIIDCPKTSVFSTIKYIVGAIILIVGTILTIKNVKKSKNNI